MSEILYSRLGGYDAIAAVPDDLLDSPSRRRGQTPELAVHLVETRLWWQPVVALSTNDRYPPPPFRDLP